MQVYLIHRLARRAALTAVPALDPEGFRDLLGNLFVSESGWGTANPAVAGLFQADDGSRTRDLRLGKPTLYQLSYVRV